MTLEHLFKGFPDACDTLKCLRNGALETGSLARWDVEWEEKAKPLISEFCIIIEKLAIVVQVGGSPLYKVDRKLGKGGFGQ
ncbi:hypothetical protein G4B88_000961, partial [Cannabis sativa]